MGKFAWPIWETLSASSPEVAADFPHVWREFLIGDLVDECYLALDTHVTICVQCFVLRCVHVDEGHRCLLAVYHGPRHVGESNHRWAE